MLFRPNFCANCGEKIERPEWFPWTSRKFCIVCEIEFKGHEWIPRIVIIGALAVGVFGFGAYLKSGTPVADLQALKQLKTNNDRTDLVSKAPLTSASVQVSQPQQPINGQPVQPLISSTNATKTPAPLKPKVELDEPVNYCGAETKKGTPCSRRVKGNTRCYQHIGMPSMVVAEKRDVGRK